MCPPSDAERAYIWPSYYNEESLGETLSDILETRNLLDLLKKDDYTGT